MLLEGLAVEAPGTKVFSLAFVNKYGLGRASNVQTATEKLLQKDVIDRDEWSYLITDRFLRLWIRRMSRDISFLSK